MALLILMLGGSRRIKYKKMQWIFLNNLYKSLLNNMFNNNFINIIVPLALDMKSKDTIMKRNFRVHLKFRILNLLNFIEWNYELGIRR